MNENDTNEREKNIFYLNWYYENFKSISKSQARTIFYIFILCFFSISLLFRKYESLNEFYDFPIIGIEISIDFLYYVLPLAITLFIVQFTGSLRSAKFAIENIEFRLKKLNWKTSSHGSDLRLYDIDTNLNFLDYLVYNFRGYTPPGAEEKKKKIPNFRELPYVFFAVFYLSTKIIMYLTFPYESLKYWPYFKYFICTSFFIDFIVSLPLIFDRLKNFIKSFANLKNIWQK